MQVLNKFEAVIYALDAYPWYEAATSKSRGHMNPWYGGSRRVGFSFNSVMPSKGNAEARNLAPSAPVWPIRSLARILRSQRREDGSEPS